MDPNTLNNILNILQICVIVGGGFYFLWQVKAELQVLSNSHKTFAERLDKVDVKLEGLIDTTIKIARQEERLDNQDKRIQELSDRIERDRISDKIESDRYKLSDRLETNRMSDRINSRNARNIGRKKST